MGEWLVEGNHFDKVFDFVLMAACFGVGMMWGRFLTFRKIVRSARENPKLVHDWAEALREEELRGAEGEGQA